MPSKITMKACLEPLLRHFDTLRHLCWAWGRPKRVRRIVVNVSPAGCHFIRRRSWRCGVLQETQRIAYQPAIEECSAIARLSSRLRLFVHILLMRLHESAQSGISLIAAPRGYGSKECSPRQSRGHLQSLARHCGQILIWPV